LRVLGGGSATVMAHRRSAVCGVIEEHGIQTSSVGVGPAFRAVAGAGGL
jgi:hypothetical protein